MSGAGAMGQLGGFVLGQVGSAIDDQRDYNTYEKIAANNMKRAREMGQFNYEMGMKGWRETNYGPQVEQMKKAGLNVGLMYKGAGAGGQLGPSGQQGAKGDKLGNGGQGTQGMAIGIQGAEATARIRNMNANSKSVELDNRTKEQFGQEADSIEANNRGLKAKAEGKMLYGEWSSSNGGEEYYDKKGTKADTRAEEIVLNDYNVSQLEGELAKEENKVVKETVKYKLMNTRFDAELKAENIELTKEQTRKVWHDIWVAWTNAGLRGLDSIIKGRLKSIGTGGKGK